MAIKIHPGQLLFVSLLTLLVSCQPAPGPQLYQQQLFAFGTLIDISIVTRNSQQAQDAISEISSEFDRLHLQWHPWKGGELAQVNQQLALLKPVAISNELAELIKQSQTLSQQSEGLFNPAIGQLIRLWQFDQLENDNFQFHLPSPKAIQSIVDRKPEMANLKVFKNTANKSFVQSDNPAVILDFGAFAKGVAIEKMLTILKAHHIDNALINAGGDLKVTGSKNQQPWRIGIKNPQNAQDPSQPAILAAIQLNSGEALFTSGDYERFFIANGRHYHHIIDPRNGYPGQGVRAVTILDTDAGRADAAATAIFLAGPEKAMNIARKMGVTHLLLIDSDNHIYLSPAMAKRLELLTENSTSIFSTHD